LHYISEEQINEMGVIQDAEKNNYVRCVQQNEYDVIGKLKWKKAAIARGTTAEIFAVNPPQKLTQTSKQKFLMFIIRPQVRFMKAQLRRKLAGKDFPLEVITCKISIYDERRKCMIQALKFNQIKLKKEPSSGRKLSFEDQGIYK